MNEFIKCKSKSFLQNYKIPDLKLIARTYQLKISGNKSELIDRIYCHFLKLNSAICIQRTFRAYMVRYFFKYMGFKNRALCVNECDGCTLEPLSSIPFERFFSCKDSHDFVYGFDIISVLTMYKKCNITNPYTREQMSDKHVKIIQTLGRLIVILFPDALDTVEKESIYVPPPPSNNIVPTGQRNENQRHQSTDRIRHLIFHTATTTPGYISTISNLIQGYLNDSERTLLYKLVELKQSRIEQRIRDLFIDIDLLGNYTQSIWFSSLDTREYFYFYRHIFDIWYYRANLSIEIRKQICSLYDPFLNIRVPSLSSIERDPYLYEGRLREICITIIENMVYGSPDPEYRKLGSMIVLMALTLVSADARNNLHWLYESVV